MSDKKEINTNCPNLILDRAIMQEYEEYFASRSNEDFCELIIQLMEIAYPRGWRWRPDNNLLLCYFKNYDEPAIIRNGENFLHCACFALLQNAGWKIISK